MSARTMTERLHRVEWQLRDLAEGMEDHEAAPWIAEDACVKCLLVALADEVRAASVPATSQGKEL